MGTSLSADSGREVGRELFTERLFVSLCEPLLCCAMFNAQENCVWFLCICMCVGGDRIGASALCRQRSQVHLGLS